MRNWPATATADACCTTTSARDLLHRRPLYRDPKAFIALLLIVLLAILIAESMERKPVDPQAPQEKSKEMPGAPKAPGEG